MVSYVLTFSRLPAAFSVGVLLSITDLLFMSRSRRRGGSRSSGGSLRYSYVTAARKRAYVDAPERYFSPFAPTLDDYERRRDVLRTSHRDAPPF